MVLSSVIIVICKRWPFNILWKHGVNWYQSWYGCSLTAPLQILCFSINQKSPTEKRPRWCKQGCFLFSFFYVDSSNFDDFFHLCSLYISLYANQIFMTYCFQVIRWSKWVQHQTWISDFLANQKPACIYKRYYMLEYKVFNHAVLHVLCFISQQNILIIQRRTEIEK